MRLPCRRLRTHAPHVYPLARLRLPPLLLLPSYDLSKILHTEDLVKGDDIFFAATGVSDGDLLRGVRYFAGGASTNSMVMRSKSGTVRYIEGHHNLARKPAAFVA